MITEVVGSSGADSFEQSDDDPDAVLEAIETAAEVAAGLIEFIIETADDVVVVVRPRDRRADAVMEALGLGQDLISPDAEPILQVSTGVLAEDLIQSLVRRGYTVRRGGGIWVTPGFFGQDP